MNRQLSESEGKNKGKLEGGGGTKLRLVSAFYWLRW